MKARSAVCFALLATLSPLAGAESASDLFMIRSTSKSPDQVVAGIKAYAESKNWQYLGDSKVKKGEVQLVKICIPEVGQQIWPVGLQLSAMLPCGNVGVYRRAGATEISVLHPRYMPLLYPHPATERAAAVAQPLLHEMLEAVANSP